MRSTLTFLSLLSILFTANFVQANEAKAVANCKLLYSILNTEGDTVPGSRIAGPSIELLTFAEQTIEFKGFTLKAHLSPVCNTSETQDLSACTANSLNAVISRRGIKSEMSVELNVLNRQFETTQAVALTTESNEEVTAVCKVKIQ